MSIVCVSTLNVTQINQINSLTEKCNGYEPYIENSDPVSYVLHYTNEQLTGFLSGENCDDHVCEITAMVDPEFRKKGIFSAMLDTLKSASDHNADTDFICCLPDHLIGTSLNKGLISCEYLLELKTVPDFKDDKKDNFEYYFSDDYDAYLMYLPEEIDENVNQDLDMTDEPIAVCSLDYQQSFTNIYEVFVDANMRGQGVGYLFMKHLISDYFEEETNPLILQVSSLNPAAYHLYKKCGFKERSHVSYYHI